MKASLLEDAFRIPSLFPAQGARNAEILCFLFYEKADSRVAGDFRRQVSIRTEIGSLRNNRLQIWNFLKQSLFLCFHACWYTHSRRLYMAYLIHDINIFFCYYMPTGISLCIRQANERRRYSVTLSLIALAHTQNYPCDQFTKLQTNVSIEFLWP